MAINIIATKRMGASVLQPPELFTPEYRAEWHPLKGGVEALRYCPSAMARGFVVDVYGEGKKIEIVQPAPTSEAEIRAVFGMVERLLRAGYRVRADDHDASMPSLTAICESYVDFNRKSLLSFVEQGFDSFHCLMGANVLLTEEDKEKIREDAEDFAAILHSQQV